MLVPRRLASKALKKVWGSPRTEPWYRNSAREAIGEVWFSASDSVPLLVKFLFTIDNLSVQVHPDDSYAARHHNSRGKTEMWHILRADPDARVALGPKETLTAARLREACESGEILELLNWVPARAGDTFFTPAGTVHAIGGGLTLCEVQQFSDVTYRLYDYGRPDRELHLDAGISVSCLEPYTGLREPEPISEGRDLLAECPYFRTERLVVTGTAPCAQADRNTIYIALSGEGTLAGEPFTQGEAWEISAGTGAFEIVSPNATFLITAEPRA